jgi:signal transduction histidine kinase
VWGFLGAASSGKEPLPVDTEARLASFTELVAMAIASAEAHADLAASRTRIVAAADETRRRIERDLHDGAQQRLVSLGLELRAASAAVPPQLAELGHQLSHASEEVTSVFEELREISHGIHPANLSNRGLVPALRALSRRSVLPIEIAAYYVVSEALTNAAKHAYASIVHVELSARDTTVRLAVRDDGIGGADRHGSGLLGLSDRIEALGGTLRVTSPVGGGTTLSIEIPLEN